jgi:hypothetical protein
MQKPPPFDPKPINPLVLALESKILYKFSLFAVVYFLEINQAYEYAEILKSIQNRVLYLISELSCIFEYRTYYK